MDESSTPNLLISTESYSHIFDQFPMLLRM